MVHVQGYHQLLDNRWFGFPMISQIWVLGKVLASRIKSLTQTIRNNLQQVIEPYCKPTFLYNIGVRTL
jgi:hypothetical protein